MAAFRISVASLRIVSSARALSPASFAYFVGDDGKALSVLAGTRCLDRGVEREEIGLPGDRADGIGDLTDALRLLTELVHGGYGILRHAGDRAHALERLAGGGDAAMRRAGDDVRGRLRASRVAGDGERTIGDAGRRIDRGVDSLRLHRCGLRDRVRGARNLVGRRGHLLRAGRKLLGGRRNFGRSRLDLEQKRAQARAHATEGIRERADFVA